MTESIGDDYTFDDELYHNLGLGQETIIDGFKLVKTCGACPEQYDVFDENGKPAGYLRLRHGRFRADYPSCGDATVYVAYPRGDGVFYDDEREHYLTEAVAALKRAHQAPAAEPPDYEP